MNTMTSRERVMAALAHKGYDRIPIKHEGTPEYIIIWAIAFEASKEAFVFLRWRATKWGLFVLFIGLEWAGVWKWFNVVSRKWVLQIRMFI